jgi:hypothetical protein
MVVNWVVPLRGGIKCAIAHSGNGTNISRDCNVDGCGVLNKQAKTPITSVSIKLTSAGSIPNTVAGGR